MSRKREFQPSHTQNPIISTSKKIKKEPVTCPICQNDIEPNVSVATPDKCPSHIFCVDCLLHWTKNSTVICPIDRTTYTEVHIYNSLTLKQSKSVSTPSRILKIDKTGLPEFKNNKNYIFSQGRAPEAMEPTHDELLSTFLENIVCKICNLSDRECDLLLCDGCDVAVHIDCLTPALTRIPEGDYFCNDCAPEYLVCDRCESKEGGEQMVICDGCDKAWHIFCLENKLDELPMEDEWFCDGCYRFEIEEVRSEVVEEVRESRTRSMRFSAGHIEGYYGNGSETVQNMIDAVINRINLPDQNVRTSRSSGNSNSSKKQVAHKRERGGRRSKKRRKTSKRVTIQKSDGFSENSSKSTTKSTSLDKPLIYGSNNLGFYEVDPTGGTSSIGKIPAPKITKVVKGIDIKSVGVRKILVKLVKMPPCPIRIEKFVQKPKTSTGGSSFLENLLGEQDAMLNSGNSKKYQTKIDENGRIISSKKTGFPKYF